MKDEYKGICLDVAPTLIEALKMCKRMRRNFRIVIIEDNIVITDAVVKRGKFNPFDIAPLRLHNKYAGITIDSRKRGLTLIQFNYATSEIYTEVPASTPARPL